MAYLAIKTNEVHKKSQEREGQAGNLFQRIQGEHANLQYKINNRAIPSGNLQENSSTENAVPKNPTPGVDSALITQNNQTGSTILCTDLVVNGKQNILLPDVTFKGFLKDFFNL